MRFVQPVFTLKSPGTTGSSSCVHVCFEIPAAPYVQKLPFGFDKVKEQTLEFIVMKHTALVFIIT